MVAMGLIRKSLRVATLPLGPAGVKGSSKKQRTSAAALKELRAANAVPKPSHGSFRQMVRANRELIAARKANDEVRMLLAEEQLRKLGGARHTPKPPSKSEPF